MVSRGIALIFFIISIFAGSIGKGSLFEAVSRWFNNEFILSFYNNESDLYFWSSTFFTSSFAKGSATLGVCEFLRIYSILYIKACLLMDYCLLMALIFYKWIEPEFKFF